MSIIIDTTKSELEEVIRYARYGANNCMIANSWEVKELVRCKDCKWSERTDLFLLCGAWDARAVDDNDFCSSGERRSE